MSRKRRGGAVGRRGSGRGLKQRLRPSKRRKASSTRWLARQLADLYVAEAQRQGLRSRAAFKLIEIDDRFKILKPGQAVVDLGAAPGGWTLVAAERVNASGDRNGPRGRVVGIDVQELQPVPGAQLIVGDFMAADAPARLKDALAGPADVVLSDLAAPATGHAATDHLRVTALLEAAFEFGGHAGLLFTHEELLDGAYMTPTYGNTLMGLAASAPSGPHNGYKIAYYAPQPRAVIEVVDFDDPERIVEYGGAGRVRLTTLTNEEVFVLLTKIRDVHVQHHGTPKPLEDAALQRFMELSLQRLGAKEFQTPRDVVRDFVNLLNLLQQYPDKKWEDLLGQVPPAAPPTSSEASPAPPEEPAIPAADPMERFKNFQV